MKKKYVISTLLIIVLLFSSATALGWTAVSKYTGGTYTHNDRFKDGLTVNAIDVSQYQKNIDWEKVKADGIDMAIIRVGGRGYGGTGRLYFDDDFQRNIAEAKEAGLLVGIYYFSQAITEEEAVEEVDHAIKLMGNFKPDLPVFMDYERAGGSGGRLNNAIDSGALTKEKATKVVETFCGALEAKGYKAGFYSNLLFLENTIDGAALGEKFFPWVAQYNTACDYEPKYNIWQYSSDGAVSGISNRSDMNFWYIDRKPAASDEKSIVNCKVEVAHCGYNPGTNHQPPIKVTYNGAVLQEGVDYRAGYIDNRKIGTAYAYVTGIGEYADYQIIPFEIYEGTGIGEEVDISSDKYTFGEYVRGVSLGTTLEQFKANVVAGQGVTYKVTDAGGIETVSGNIGTGMKVFVYGQDGKLAGSAPIVVTGDSTGDGVCNVFDLIDARKHIAEFTALQGAYGKAVDINKDDKINIFDLIDIRKHIAQLKPIV